MNTAKLHIRQPMRVLICIMIVNNIALADKQISKTITNGTSYTLKIKDLHNIKNIHITKSKLLSSQYLGLDKACANWKFNEQSLRDFFSISKAYESGIITYHTFMQIPCIIKGSFVLDKQQYYFQIQAGGSFEICDKNDKRFYFGCDGEKIQNVMSFYLKRYYSIQIT